MKRPSLTADEAQLVTDNLAVVRHTVRAIIGRLDDDLIQAGYVGLIEAAQRFDPDRGWKFSSFARLRVRGVILDALGYKHGSLGEQRRLNPALSLESSYSDDLEPSPDCADAAIALVDTVRLLDHVSDREAFVLRRLMAGRAKREIAAELGRDPAIVSQLTASIHRRIA